MTDASNSQPVGSIWEIKTKKDQLAVTAPDGDELTFLAYDELVSIALDTAGEWSTEIDGKPVTIKAG